MPIQELVPDVGASTGPSWTVHDGNHVWLAWKGEGVDTGIYVSHSAGLRPDSAGDYSFIPQHKVLALTTPNSTTITSLNGTLYLFYQGEIDQQVYSATCADRKTWVDKHLLSMGDTLAAAAAADNDVRARTDAGPTVVCATSTPALRSKP